MVVSDVSLTTGYPVASALSIQLRKDSLSVKNSPTVGWLVRSRAGIDAQTHLFQRLMEGVVGDGHPPHSALVGEVLQRQ
jgi:hypothetical protein